MWLSAKLVLAIPSEGVYARDVGIMAIGSCAAETVAMQTRELLSTLSGCRFHQRYLTVCPHSAHSLSRLPARPRAKPFFSLRPITASRTSDQVFLKYSALLVGLLVGVVLIVVAPLWAVYPPYGRSCLLGVPPMFLCALSWMVGAWWAWNRDEWLFMALTMGAIPVRIAFVLAWCWLVLMIPGIALVPLVLAMMLSWTLFSVAEVGMLLELSSKAPKQRADGDKPH